MGAWRSMWPLWKIQETSPALLPMPPASPREGWSSSWLWHPTWQTAPAEAGTRPLSPPPPTSWPPRRWRCPTTRQGEPTGGCRWWSWRETLPSLGGAARPPLLESGCSRSSTTAQGMTRWCTGWSVYVIHACCVACFIYIVYVAFSDAWNQPHIPANGIFCQ